MKQARLWILGAALGSFAGGLSVGSVIPKVLAGESAEPAPEQQYASKLVARFGLSPQQERSLRFVLQDDREQEYAILTSAQHNQLPPDIQSRLLSARSRTEQRIRALLDPEQRARYDRESRPTENR